MSYIIQQFADRLTPEEQSHLIHGHYFLSDADLGRFWRERASAAVKCRTVDLADYLADGRSRKALSAEKARHEAAKRTKGEGQRHDAEMRRLLIGEGYMLLHTSGAIYEVSLAAGPAAGAVSPDHPQSGLHHAVSAETWPAVKRCCPKAADGARLRSDQS